MMGARKEQSMASTRGVAENKKQEPKILGVTFR
jgi:hypothetical protein